MSEPAERWRRPATVIDVDEDPSRLYALGPGRYATDVIWTHTPETIARIRLGYVCVICTEVHEQAFPERCICGFPMRDAQMEQFNRLYVGEEKLKGGGVDAELAEMAEERERREHNPNSQIWLPRGV